MENVISIFKINLVNVAMRMEETFYKHYKCIKEGRILQFRTHFIFHEVFCYNRVDSAEWGTKRGRQWDDACISINVNVDICLRLNLVLCRHLHHALMYS